jgi:tetratricopeptide (TPR) repeat protein
MIRFIAAGVAVACFGGAAQAQIAGDPAREKAFLAQIELAKAEPAYRENIRGLDVARALLGGGLPLTTWQRANAGESAMNRGVPIEAEILLLPLIETGEFAGEKDSKRARNASLFAVVQADADADRTGGLEKSAENAAKKVSGHTYLSVGEGFAAMGEYGRAAQLFTAALAKGGFSAADTGYAKLDLGMAQFRAGDKQAARATWNSVEGDGGAKELAKAWLMIAG